MLRVFQDELSNPSRFVITLELVPGRESFGQSVDVVKGIAADSFSDGRISAVSITDNPGGNPSSERFKGWCGPDSGARACWLKPASGKPEA